MKKILLLSFLLFLVACPKKEEKNTVEKVIDDATTNVKKQLGKVEDAANKNKEDFAKKIKEESSNMADTATGAVNKSLDAAKEIGSEIKESTQPSN